MRRFLFFTLGYLYAAVCGYMSCWKAEREAYRFQKELRKVINTPYYKAERRIDEYLYELERR